MYAMTGPPTVRERPLPTWPDSVSSRSNWGADWGPCQSYFRLLSAARVDGAYVAFCDQDDLWLPGKLWRAVSLLEGSARQPSMYCGRLTFADAELNPVGLSPLPRRKLSLSNALVENVAPGPTVINTKGRELITKKLPAYAIMHDAWSYLVFSAGEHRV